MSKSLRTPPSNLSLRLAKPSDAAELVTLIHSSYRGEGGWTTEAHIVVGDRLTLDEAKVLLEDPMTWENEPVFVAELDESGVEGVEGGGKRLVGCIQPSRGSHGSSSSHVDGRVSKDKGSSKKIPHTEIVNTPNGEHKEEILVVPAMPEVMQPTPSPSPSPAPPSFPTTPSASESESSAIFGLFAVHPSYQSHGIGSFLVKHALSHMRSVWHCKKCIIWVLENRPELLAWYVKMGFEWHGETRPFVFPEYLKEKAEFRVLEMRLD